MRLRTTWPTSNGRASAGTWIVSNPPGSALSPTVRRLGLTATRQRRSTGSPESARTLASLSSFTQSVVALIGWASDRDTPPSVIRAVVEKKTPIDARKVEEFFGKRSGGIRMKITIE